MKKLILPLMLLCPALQAVHSEAAVRRAQRQVQRQAQRQAQQIQPRIERVRNYLAHQYDREEDQDFYDEPIVAPSLQAECYPIAICVAACCVFVASMMYLQN